MKRLPLALSALAIACATETATPNGQSVAPDQAVAANSGDADSVEVNDTKPIPLDKWRTVDKEGKDAIRSDKLDEKITKCKAFVEKHPDHYQAGPVLEALTDALIENGNFNPEELAKYVELRAKADDDATRLPLELVREYHIKHGLPVDSAIRLLSVGRERIARDWKDLEFEEDKGRRERMEVFLHYREADTYIAEARILLETGDAKKAKGAIKKAEESAGKFARDIAFVDGNGKEVRRLSWSLMDPLNVLSAAADHQLKDDAAAKKSLAKTVGFLDDPKMRELYEETQAALGVPGAKGTTVTAAAQPAQNFELEDLKGKKVKLSDYRGKVTMVAFWATWCGPCKKELPELQKFARANKDKGVELIAISIDRFDDRSKIKPFLEKNNLDFKVLLEKPEQLSSYNYRGIPALYVIDREGKVAHARTGYDPNLKEKLSKEILETVEGKRDSGRDLLTIEDAPKGFGVLWKAPVSGDASAVAVGSPIGGGPGEVAVVGRKGLMRWSATGEALGDKPVAGFTRSLEAADLDRDGKREWVLGGWQALKVLDSKGELYWERAAKARFDVAGIDDLNNDGFSEIVLQENGRVIVLKSVPETMWKSRPFKDLEAVTVGPGGSILVQADGEMTELDARGQTIASGVGTPNGRIHSGRIKGSDGHVDLFQGRWDPEPILDVDVDGDGEDDVVLAGHDGLIAYSRTGKTILRVRANDVGTSAAVGDLDGKPGDEVVLFVDHFGLVVLGKK